MTCLRMPTGGECVDNFAAGGIAAPIDRSTARLGIAVAKDPTRGEFLCHPDSGAPIRGRVVPFFHEGIAVAQRAHDCYPEVPFIGWDVVVTPAGPILLEANPNWCTELAQIAMDIPLGETDYPKIFLEHIEAQNQEVPST